MLLASVRSRLWQALESKSSLPLGLLNAIFPYQGGDNRGEVDKQFGFSCSILIVSWRKEAKRKTLQVKLKHNRKIRELDRTKSAE